MPSFHLYEGINQSVEPPEQVEWLGDWERFFGSNIHVIFGQWGSMTRETPRVAELNIPETDFIIFDCASSAAPRTEHSREYLGDAYATANRNTGTRERTVFNRVNLPWNARTVHSSPRRSSSDGFELISARVYQMYRFGELQRGARTFWTRYGLRNFQSKELLDFIYGESVWRAISGEKEAPVWEKKDEQFERTQMLKLFEALHQNKLASAKMKVTNAESTMTSLEQQIASAWDTLRLARIEERVLVEAVNGDKSKMDSEFAKIEQSESFEKFGFNKERNAFYVVTRPFYLYKENRRERVPMGKARIEMSLDGRHSFSYFPNDPKVDGASGDFVNHIHPHTGDNGHMCMGSYQGHPSRLVHTGDLAAGFEQALMLLEVFNPSDVGPSAYDMFPDRAGATLRGRNARYDAEYYDVKTGEWLTKAQQKEKELEEEEKKKRSEAAKKAAATRKKNNEKNGDDEVVRDDSIASSAGLGELVS